MNDISDSTEQVEDDPTGVVRHESFDADGPLDIEVAIGNGRVSVALTDEPGASVRIQHDPNAGSPWMQGISNLITWVSGQFGEPSTEKTPTAAIEAIRVELVGKRLVVRERDRRYRAIPLAVTVRAPAGSHLELRSSSDVTVTGAAGRVSVHAGSGDVALDRADGAAEVRLGSGALRLGPMLGGLRAQSGSGEIEVSSIGGASTLTTGSGDIWLGAVSGDVRVRTGSGDLTIADAAKGDIDLVTGSGEIKVGIRAGTPAMVDLVSGSGQAHSELDVTEAGPTEAPTLRVRDRTGSGNAVISTATS